MFSDCGSETKLSLSRFDFLVMSCEDDIYGNIGNLRIYHCVPVGLSCEDLARRFALLRVGGVFGIPSVSGISCGGCGGSRPPLGISVKPSIFKM